MSEAEHEELRSCLLTLAKNVQLVVGLAEAIRREPSDTARLARAKRDMATGLLRMRALLNC